MIKPAWPKFRHKDWRVRSKLLDPLELGLRAELEVGCHQLVIYVSPVPGQSWGVRGEQQRFDSRFPENRFQEPQMRLVSRVVPISIVSKLIFNLGHDYGSSEGATLCIELEVFDLCHQLLQDYPGSLFIPLIGTSEEHGVFVKQPGGKATEFPFSADIRSGPEDCQHVLLLDHLNEGGQVEEG